MLKIDDSEVARFSGDNLLSDVWQEYLKCRVCNERMGAYALKATMQGVSVESICVKCLVTLATRLNEKAPRTLESIKQTIILEQKL